MEFWTVFFNLCREKGKAPNTVAKELGISSASITWWKKGERNPSQKTLKAIADYFGVPVAYLLNEEKEKAPGTLTEGEKLLIDTFRRVPVDKQELVLQMIRLALDNQE